MSNIIPPLLSDTPPPPPEIDDHEDDEFGDFTGTNNLSYDCDDSFSPPGSPLQLPTESFETEDPVPTEIFDCNSNSKENVASLDKSKDFCDKRKDDIKVTESPVDSSVIHDSVSSNITNYRIDEKVPISSDPIAPVFYGVQNLPAENQELNKLKNNDNTIEITETNCDTKTTFSQKEISSLSSRGSKEHSEGLFSESNEPCNIKLKIDESNILNNEINDFSDFASVSDDIPKSYKGANLNTNFSDTLYDNTLHNPKSEQCVNLGNNSSIEDAPQIGKDSIVDTDTVEKDSDAKDSLNLNIDQLPFTNIDVFQDLSQNTVKFNELKVTKISEVDLETSQTEVTKVESADYCEQLKVDGHEIQTESNTSVIETVGHEKILSELPDNSGNGLEEKVENSSVESVANDCSCLGDFGAFIRDTKDVQKISLENYEFGEYASDHFVSNHISDDDGFGDFTSMSSHSVDRGGVSTNLSSLQASAKHKKEDNSNIDLGDNDFGDFATTEAETSKSSNKKCEKQEFKNFASFPTSQNLDQNDFDDEDDFGDFATTSVTPSQEPHECELYSKILLLNEKQALEKSIKIVKEMFPTIKQTTSDFECKGLEATDKIFNQIKNITDTHALSYQWSKSASQNLLLKALNIDSRNILYGPGWNSSMPRFAANLSLTPLEPVKSEFLVPTPAKETNPSNSSPSADVEVPQFDLNELGLTDPLDLSSQSMLLDLQQLVAQLEIPSFNSTSSSHNSTSPSNEIENWEAWLKSIPSKEPNISTDSANYHSKIISTESIVSLKLEPTILHDGVSMESSKTDLEQKDIPSIKHDDFDDFVSYSSPVHEKSHGHNIILRETHISSKEPSKADENDIVSWLEPTIVTPELSRKERQFVEPDDEFDEFHMVVVPSDLNSNPAETSANLSVKPLEVLQPQSTVRSENRSLQATVDLGIIEDSVKNQGTQNIIKDSNILESKETDIKRVTLNDDDFGDFTFSLPEKTSKLQNVSVIQPTMAPTSRTQQLPSLPSVQPIIPAPLMEPLKPSVIQTQNMASISWPDPGITDDEISRLEALGYARAQNKQSPIVEKVVADPNKNSANDKELNGPSFVQNHQRKGSNDPPIQPKVNHVVKPTKSAQQSKQNSLDDEEWSDFVSGQNSSPVHKLKTEKERSSTPDLPLSVLNLGSVQPAKQPIPVITPNGLVQTKLSSNMSLNFPNVIQQTSRVYPQPQVQNNPVYQPSIISNQYATQAYGGFTSYGSYRGQTANSAGSRTNGDDDEWSDFVSHQPVVQKTNQAKPSQGWPSQPNQLSSWTNTTPNIITNPAAGFDVFSSSSSVQKQVKKVSGPVQNRRSGGVSNVSIPDLDFLAPRNRTVQRK